MNILTDRSTRKFHRFKSVMQNPKFVPRTRILVLHQSTPAEVMPIKYVVALPITVPSNIRATA